MSTTNTPPPVLTPAVSREATQAKMDRYFGTQLLPLPSPNWTVMDAFERVVARDPAHTCLIYDDRTLSYGALDELAARYATLALQSGLRAGGVGAVMVENRPEFFAAWMGLSKVGVTAALINTFARKRALEHALHETGSKVLFIGAECLDQLLEILPATEGIKVFVIRDGERPLPALPPAFVDLDSIIGAVAPVANCQEHRQGVQSTDPCFLVFTSGTTGLPKAARIGHRRYLGVGEAWKAIANLGPGDVFYCALPLFHGAALYSLFSTAIATGGTTLVRRKFSTSQFWPDVHRHRATVFQYVGEVCRYLTNAPETTGEDRHTLRVLLGSGMGIDVWTKFTLRFGSHIQIYEGWGATESNGNMTNFDNKPGACGRIPFRERSHIRLVRFDPETETHPRNAAGQFIECEPGEAGEIICQIARADGTVVSPFEGYTNEAESRRKVLADVFERGDRWWRSGDLFRRDEDDYYYFVDRIGDTFRFKAENVSTTEVTQQLSQALPDVESWNVYGVPVPTLGGQAGMAAIVMKPGHAFDPGRLYEAAARDLPHYAVPVFVRVSQQAELTANFKLRKVDLRAQGFDPRKVADPLYVVSHRLRTYVPLDEAALRDIGVPMPGAD